MDTWSKQSGFPVMTIKREADDILISQRSILLEKALAHKKGKSTEESDEEENEEEKPKE